MADLHVIRDPAAARAVLDPIRQRLLKNLEFPVSATGLSRRLRLPRQKINYHLRELERSGLVRLVEKRTVGNCTERLMQAVAKEFVLGPELLGALTPEPRTAADSTRSYAARFRDGGKKLQFLVDLNNEVIRLLEQHGAGPDETAAEETTVRLTTHPSGTRRLPDPKLREGSASG